MCAKTDTCRYWRTVTWPWSAGPRVVGHTHRWTGNHSTCYWLLTLTSVSSLSLLSRWLGTCQMTWPPFLSPGAGRMKWKEEPWFSLQCCVLLYTFPNHILGYWLTGSRRILIAFMGPWWVKRPVEFACLQCELTYDNKTFIEAHLRWTSFRKIRLVQDHANSGVGLFFRYCNMP